jgi:hypothetical protein
VSDAEVRRGLLIACKLAVAGVLFGLLLDAIGVL